MEITGLDMIKKEEVRQILGLEQVKPTDSSVRVSSFAVRLIDLVNRASDLDLQREEFGAEFHQYSFNTVIPLSEVEHFEQVHHIKLPDAYVDFVTQVGNGGAGPGYGFLPLDTANTEEKLSRPSMYHSAYTEEQFLLWKQELAQLPKDEYDQKRQEAWDGLLPLVRYGCGYYAMLICSGEYSGKIVSLDLDLNTTPRISEQTFEDLALGWVNGVIAKYRDDKI